MAEALCKHFCATNRQSSEMESTQDRVGIKDSIGNAVLVLAGAIFIDLLVWERMWIFIHRKDYVAGKITGEVN